MATDTVYTEQELFRQIAAGDEAAFSVIFHRYRSPLFDFACKLTRSHTIAEELVQDCFLKLWAYRLQLSTVDNPAAYIHQIAKNAALDHFRRLTLDRNLRRRTLHGLDLGANTTLEALDHGEARRLVGEATRLLPHQQQQIFRLSRYEGLSYAEIAEHLEISIHTVRNHLVKALASIRDYLAAHYGAPVALIIMSFLEGRH